MTVADKREAVSLMKATGLSERKACELLAISRSVLRYEASKKEDAMLREKIRGLAFEKRRYGYRRIAAKIRRDGDKVNAKRVYRIYCEENLKVRIRRRKRLSVARGEMAVPSAPNIRWSMDFTSDSLYSGRRFRTLNIVDEFSRDSLGIDVSFSIPSGRVTRFLDRMIWMHGKPEKIKCDNGPEFRSKHTQKWAADRGILLDFIQPGKPMQNAFCESFNGKFRDECLTENWFVELEEAQQKIEQWRNEYNTERPHSALNYQTPLEFRNSHLEAAV